MKVLKDGKEVKGTVIYSVGGRPTAVIVDGVRKNASAFEFVDSDSKKKTQLADRKKAELVEMAKEQELTGYSSMTKAELVKELS